tara:strand:- start:1766 stop:2692 length:927 start_codon:yes stop_codon:yes gene_type:complete
MYYDDTQSSHVLSTPTDIFELPDELKFTPVLRPIEHSGSSISTSLGQKIVNENTDEVLGIVKSRYNPRPYNDLWEPLVEGLKMSNLDLSNAKVRFQTMNNNARMYADIELEAYNFEKIIGEPTSLALRVRNSIDGSIKYDVSAFIRRLDCLNGMSRIAENTSVAFKHTANTEPEKIGKMASTWPEVLVEDGHLFNHMRKIPVARDNAQTFLATNLCVTKTKSENKINKKWLNLMMGLWDTYSSSIGNNGYALYNSLTHYGTHVDSSSLRGAEYGDRVLRQEQNVQTLVRGKAFKNLIRYDDFEQSVAA